MGPGFSSSRIVTLSELPEHERSALIRFLAEQKVQAFKDIDGSFVANIRLYDPNVIDMSAYQRGKQGKETKGKGRGKDAAEGGEPRVGGGRDNSPFDYSSYGKFTSLVSGRETVKPKSRPLAWVMRLVEELYDSKYAKDTADLPMASDGDVPESSSSSFPTFVVDFFTKRYGLRSLIDQNCWDLLYNVHVHRNDRLEVEMFARFLEQQFDSDDLLFFLYVRSVVQKEMGVSFRSRWSELGASANNPVSPRSSYIPPPGNGAPAPLFLTFKECQMVARTIFGSEADPLYKTFLSMIDRNMASQDQVDPRSRRIEATQFLHLALVEYHETRPADETEGGDSAADFGLPSSPAPREAEDSTPSGGLTEADRLYREAEAAYEARLKGQSKAGGASSSDALAVMESYGVSDADFQAAASALRRSPQFFDELGERMHRANETYLDRALSGAGATGLPAEVQQQIRAEVTNQLEPKVDSLLACTIKAVQTFGAGAAGKTSAQVLEGTSPSLVAHFLQVLLGGGRGAEGDLDGFCAAVLAQEEVKKAVEPLVALLVSYATSRLQDA